MSYGRLVAVVGAMATGKTETLCRMYNEYSADGKKVVAFKPSLDTRHPEPFIIGRAGGRVPCSIVRDSQEIIKHHEVEDADVILIDEIQFFEEAALIDSLETLCLGGRDVYVFGLDLTAEGKTFGKIGEVCAHADEIIKLTTKCALCGVHPARVSKYMRGEKKEKVLLGDIGDYLPVCRRCLK